MSKEISNQIIINGTVRRVEHRAVGVQLTSIRVYIGDVAGIDREVEIRGNDETPGLARCKQGSQITVLGTLTFHSGLDYPLVIFAAQVW